ncbi:MAG: RecB family exonuclease [Actinomycetota bacterium]
MKLSFSSINTYETCPAKFRFQYQDRLPTGRSPALAFGDSLHRALHRFHDRPVPVAPSAEELLEWLEDVWVSEGYTNGAEERRYRDHARQVLSQYHRDNAAQYRIPAALEHRFEIDVEGVTLAGIIDRMDRLPEGGYEIIDYKTNRRLPTRSMVDRDLQLSIYHLAARELWGIEPERLTLYYLLAGQRMSTTRSAADLQGLRGRVGQVAGLIEAGRFEARENALCRWCDFQPRCPLFRHRYERDRAPARIGDLVDEWVLLARQETDRQRRMDELGSTIAAYGLEHGLRRLYGNDGAVEVVEGEDGHGGSVKPSSSLSLDRSGK